jgi:hypothetical protein
MNQVYGLLREESPAQFLARQLLALDDARGQSAALQFYAAHRSGRSATDNHNINSHSVSNKLYQ